MELLIGTWIGFTIVGCYIVKRKSNKKLRIMSCRHTLRRYKKLDDCDNKSLF